MPSPVIGSVAAAASPTNRVRPARRARPGRPGPGWATPGGATRAGRRARGRPAMWGRASSSGHSASCPATRATLPPRRMPKPTLAPPPGERERPGVAGQQVGLEPHDAARSAARGRHVGEVLPEGVPLAPVAVGSARPSCLAQRRPHAVGADGVARPRTGAEPVDVEPPRRRRPARRLAARRARRAPWRRRRGPRSTRAASRSRAAGDGARSGPPSRGSGKVTSWPDGRADHDVVDVAATTARRPGRGRGPRAAAAPPVVSPSPQILSRGNVALSTTVTVEARARQRGGRGRARRAGTDHHDVGGVNGGSHGRAGYGPDADQS